MLAANLRRIASLLIFSQVCVSALFAQAPAPRLLSQSELIALVAGNALPENILYQINRRGVCPADPNFLALLKRAGADTRILAAAGSTKTGKSTNCADKPQADLLNRVANAAELIGNRQFPEAGKQLDEAFSVYPENLEIAFVMADLLRLQDSVDRAASLYRGWEFVKR